MKLLTAFFSLLSGLFQAWREAKLREQGRQEQASKAKEVHDANVAKAQQVDAIVDPNRGQRLRSRFDRSNSSE